MTDLMGARLKPFYAACPSCRTEFPVDPERVPEEGIHAICGVCARTFLVTLPEEDERAPESQDFASPRIGEVEPEALEAEAVDEAETEPPMDVAVAPETESAPEGEPVPEFELDPEFEQPPEIESLPESPPVTEVERNVIERDEADLSSLATEAMQEEDPEDPAGEVRGKTLSQGIQRFGQRDPGDRARRLARVLVSDMIAYHPVRYRASLERGTLREDFADEVQRLWEEYVEQIGEELATSTPYFTEALNEILAQGEEIF